MLLGNKIRSLRDEQGILQRQVAAYLEIDTPLDRWYDYIAEPTLADAIMDRLINSSEHIELKGETLRHNRRRK